MEDCPDISWQSGNGDQEGVDEHFVVGYRVALKKRRFLSLLKMKPIFQERKNCNFGAVHNLRHPEGREGCYDFIQIVSKIILLALWIEGEGGGFNLCQFALCCL